MAQYRRVDEVRQRDARAKFYYGWLVVSTAFLMTLLSIGIQSSFGNFLKPSTSFGLWPLCSC